jgi:hypothetical protein
MTDRQGHRAQPPGERGGDGDVARRLEPAERDREREHEGQGDEEAGDREPQNREHLNGPVDPSPVDGCQDPDHDGDDRGDDGRADDDRQGDSKPVGDALGHDLTGEPGSAEVTLDGVRQPVEVLRDERAVEAQFGGLAGDDLLGGVLTEDAARDVAAGEVEEAVRDDRDDEDEHDPGEQAPNDEPDHDTSLWCEGRRTRGEKGPPGVSSAAPPELQSRTSPSA